MSFIDAALCGNGSEPGWPPIAIDVGIPRADIIEGILDAMVGIVINNLDTPALNKWGKLFPVHAKLMTSLGVHNYLSVGLAKKRFGCIHALGDAAEAGRPENDCGEGDVASLRIDREDPNAPTVEQRAFNVLSKTRKDKATRCATDPDTAPYLSIWLSVSRMIMSLHYLLFSSGRMGHRAGIDAEKDRLRFEQMLDLSQPESGRSPAVRILEDLTSMLLTTAATFCSLWCLTLSLLGDVEAWPSRCRERAHASICILLGQVYRRLVVEFLRYPWLLSEAIDGRNSMAQRRRRRDEYYSCNMCDLDEGLS